MSIVDLSSPLKYFNQCLINMSDSELYHQTDRTVIMCEQAYFFFISTMSCVLSLRKVLCIHEYREAIN